jgi:hypothetical protein
MLSKDGATQDYAICSRVRTLHCYNGNRTRQFRGEVVGCLVPTPGIASIIFAESDRSLEARRVALKLGLERQKQYLGRLLSAILKVPKLPMC